MILDVILNRSAESVYGTPDGRFTAIRLSRGEYALHDHQVGEGWNVRGTLVNVRKSIVAVLQEDEAVAKLQLTAPEVKTTQYQPGDVIGLPAEPPVGTVLEAKDSDDDTFQFDRTEDGWGLVGWKGRVPWGRVFQVWGPASNGGHPFTVVSLPGA